MIFALLLTLAALTGCSQSRNTVDAALGNLTPGKLSFNGPQVQQLSLHNDDDVPIEITNAEVVGADADAFAKVGASRFPLTLAPGQGLSLSVRFTPQPRQKAYSAALRITGDTTTRVAVEVAMNGRVDQPEDDGWTPLFNGKNLDGWTTHLPATGQEDPEGVFKVHDGMLHVLGVPVTGERREFGYIARPEVFWDYHLKFEYRWGAKRFKPRDATKRDSGLLYHVVGPDRVWPRSVELQVQEGDTGDVWLIGGTTASTTVVSPLVTEPQYKEGGRAYTTAPGKFVRLVKSATNDTLTGWNTVELIVRGDEATHIINGVVNNQVTNLRQPDPKDAGKMIPLTQGRILFQAEGAEVFYRNIMIKKLD
jgi:hypothetical protein